MKMENSKPFEISKHLIMNAWMKVRANAGAAGIDGKTIEDCERNLKKNLYKVWNRMSSGSYMPPPVRGVEIPKKGNGVRVLGVPAVMDRVAQTAVKMLIEPRLEKIFVSDSYGYRPGKSAHDAIAVTRERCWKYNWVLEYDIVGLFDNLDHQLLLKAVRHHVKEKWILIYIERWIKAPLINSLGKRIEKKSGTPQGGVISPVLSNLFLHYAIDNWMDRELGHIPYCRYCDDGLMHCKTKAQADFVLKRLKSRLAECGLEIHPAKSKIVFCGDDNRKGEGVESPRSFVFLGFEFKARSAKNRNTGKLFRCFLPGTSKEAIRAMKYQIKHKMPELKFTHWSLEEIAKAINPRIRGWFGYYGKFYPWAFQPIVKYLNVRIMRWMRRKFKSLYKKMGRALTLLKRIHKSEPDLFVHWQLNLGL